MKKALTYLFIIGVGIMVYRQYADVRDKSKVTIKK